MVEVGDTQSYYGGYDGGMLLVFGDFLVEDVAFCMPDLVVAEVISLYVFLGKAEGG